MQWTQGLLFFLVTDPSVPTGVQAEVARFGLPASGFLVARPEAATDHRAHLLSSPGVVGALAEIMTPAMAE